VAKYYSPSGKAIQDNSVTPGFTVADAEPDALDDEDAPAATPAKEPAKPGEDLILKKGLDVLNGKAEQAKAQVKSEGQAMGPLNIPAGQKP